MTIRANQASVKRLLPRLIEHIQDGPCSNPKAMITHRIPLEEVSDAYHGCSRPSWTAASSPCCCRPPLRS